MVGAMCRVRPFLDFGNFELSCSWDWGGGVLMPLDGNAFSDVWYLGSIAGAQKFWSRNGLHVSDLYTSWFFPPVACWCGRSFRIARVCDA